MNFKDYFSISPSAIKETCIICQTYDLSLFSDKSQNAFFLKTASLKNATIIALKNNFLAGDTVLYLKNSNCKKIILFGSCGGCGDIESGDLVMIDKAYNYESFSKMLSIDKDPENYSFSSDLMHNFYSKNIYSDLIKTNSACISSLLLEKEYIDQFKKLNIHAVDMESSIIASASKKINVDTLCLFYIADHIEHNPLGKPMEDSVKKRISSARKKLSEMILRFCDEI